jgi:predicted DNA-binding transcriptional regulator YafY
MRGRNLAKIFKAVQIIGRKTGATIKEIGEEIGIGRRSVYRLRDTLEELGFKIYDEKLPLEREVRWKFDESYLKRLPNFMLPEFRLSFEEVFALYLMKNEARIFRGTETEQIIDRVFGKVESYLPEGIFSKLDKIGALFVPSEKFTKDYGGKEELVEDLANAMLQQQTCLVEYHSFYRDKVVTIPLDPLHFFENNGGLYLFARYHESEDILTLAVERILSFEKGEGSFEYPEDFDPGARLDEAFDLVWDDPVEATIKISESQVKYIKERRLGGRISFHDQQDGSSIMEIQTSGRWDLIRWILAQGSEVEVLGPNDLRQEIAKSLKRALEPYNS